MIKRKSTDWNRFLKASLKQLLSRPPVKFAEMTPSMLPQIAGVYLITKLEGGSEIPYYIGRTKNISKRLYRYHLMGSLASAPLKKYLVDNHVCSTIEEAKDFMLSNCAARWIEEADYRKRGAIESYCTSILFPEYGIEQEH